MPRVCEHDDPLTPNFPVVMRWMRLYKTYRSEMESDRKKNGAGKLRQIISEGMAFSRGHLAACLKKFIVKLGIY